MIEDESRAVASNARGVVEAAVVAHGERDNREPADLMLLRHAQRAPIQLSDGRGGGAGLEKVGDGDGQLLQRGLVRIHVDAAAVVVVEAHGAVLGFFFGECLEFSDVVLGEREM